MVNRVSLLHSQPLLADARRPQQPCGWQHGQALRLRQAAGWRTDRELLKSTQKRIFPIVAVAYADQTEVDYAAFTRAADEQRIAVQTGV